jgi:predicted ester cyclase
MTAIMDETAVAQRFYAILDGHDPDLLRGLCSPDLVGHGGAGSNLEELIENVRGFQSSFSDLAVAEIRHLVREGEVVATWVRYEGTHDGDFAGVAGSGRRVRFLGWDVFRIRDGLIVELTQHCDLFAILNQIGALPTATPA